MSHANPPLSATDLLAVKSRVSWGAIAAGAMVSLAIYLLLNLIGVAVGLEFTLRPERVYLPIGAVIWSIAALLISMFFGGWTTSRLAVGETKMEAFLYGVILWGVLFSGLFWLIGQGVRVGFGALAGLASGAVVVRADDPTAAASNGPVTTLMKRYSSDFGGEKFVEDLTKLGVERDRAERIQKLTKEKIDAIHTDPTSIPAQIDQAANDPAVRQTADELRDMTRKAIWYTLGGVVVSMLAVIFGSLAGSGVVPVPVPLLGVRKPTAPSPRA